MASKKRATLFAGFVLISIIVAIFSGYFGLSLGSVNKFVSTNFLVSAIIYNLLFIVLASFSFSISVMTSLGVLVFSVYWVIIFSMIAVIASSIIDFYIARKLGKDYVRDYLEKRGGKLEKFDEILEKNTFKTILILSAIAVVPPAVPNFLGGVMKINLRNYSIATFFGNLPNTVFTAYLIHGFLYSNSVQIYVSIAGLVAATLIALYFYKGETTSILKLSFPWVFRASKKS
jgi:uncharacterized membrane protein YdjX (TVP38/TMEM64 family)